MGKGTILESLGEGQYSIVEELDFTRVQARQIFLEDKKVTNQSDIVTFQLDFDQALAIRDAFQIAIDDYIALNNTIDDNVRTLISEQQIAAATAGRASIRLSQAEADLISIEKELEAIDEALSIIDLGGPIGTLKRQKIAWCADHTTNLSGEVGLIEPHRQARDVAIIQPGESPRSSAWISVRDGQIQPTLASSPSGTYWNAAMMPGAGVFRARHAVGGITALDTNADTASVLMDLRDYRFLGAGVFAKVPNNEFELFGIPVVYSSCNAVAFEVGDRAVVEFDENGQNPTVIGFESNPRECTGDFGYITLSFRFDTVNFEAYSYLIQISGDSLPDPNVKFKASITGIEFDFTTIPVGNSGPFNGFYQGLDDLLYRITIIPGPTLAYRFAVQSNMLYFGTFGQTSPAANVPTDTSGTVTGAILSMLPTEDPSLSFPDDRVRIYNNQVLPSPAILLADSTNLTQQVPDTPDIYFEAAGPGPGIFIRPNKPDKVFNVLYEDGVASIPAITSPGGAVATTQLNTFGTFPLLDPNDKFSVVP